MQFLRCSAKCLYTKKNSEIENKSTSTKQELRNWSDLPYDILLLIILKLFSLLDVMSFERVCSSWRIAIRNKTSSPYQASPAWLPILSPVRSPPWVPNTKQKFVCSITKNRPVDDVQYSSRIIGSRPDGWVILTNQILHSNHHIRLKLPNMTYSRPGAADKGKLIPEDDMSKAAICTFSGNPLDFIVAMTFHYRHPAHQNVMRLAYWRGSTSWSIKWTVFGGISPPIEDIAFCSKSITLYTITRPGDKFIVAWCFRFMGPTIKLRVRIDEAFGDNFRLVQSLVVSFSEEIYVVNYDYLSRCVIYKLDSNKKVMDEHPLLISSFGDSIRLSSFVEYYWRGLRRLFTLRKVNVHRAYIVMKEEDCEPSII